MFSSPCRPKLLRAFDTDARRVPGSYFRREWSIAGETAIAPTSGRITVVDEAAVSPRAPV
jgi:hypothetical protein